MCLSFLFWIWPAADPPYFRSWTPASEMILVLCVYLRAVLAAQQSRLQRWGTWRLLSRYRLVCGSSVSQKVMQADCSHFSSDCPCSARGGAPTTETSHRSFKSILSDSWAAPGISSFSWTMRRVDNKLSKDLSCSKTFVWLLINCNHQRPFQSSYKPEDHFGHGGGCDWS